MLNWVVGGVSVLWIGLCGLAIYRLLHVPSIDERNPGELPKPAPRLSVVIPACNEEDTLERAMRSLLAVDYPTLELVLVDDRSTDGTPQIVDRLASEDERVVAIHITELPGEWLGKVHALHVGTQRATGEWLLFADADVRYSPSALTRAVSFAEHQGFDHIGLIPEIERSGFLHNVLTETFGLALVLTIPLHRVPDAGNDLFFGVGAFNLVRREVFEKTEGWEWLRMEIADDMGLGLLLQRHGARTFGGVAPESLTLEWYGSVSTMIRGLRKNLYAAMAQLQPWRAVVLLMILVVLVVAPFSAVAATSRIAIGLAMTIPLFLALVTVVNWKRWGTHPFALLFLPLGVAILGYALARSSLAYWRDGGAHWRGSFYPIEELRKYQRVKF